MATEADIPAPVCEARGDQVGTIVDNIIKISVGQLSLEKQIQDDKHNELPIVEGENFLKPPSTVEVHCEATPDISKVIEEPDQTVREDMDALLLSTKDTSSDLNGTSDSYTEKIELTKEILQETSLLGEETESHTPCISESEELNVQSKTIDTESADQKPTEEDMSSDLTNKVASKQEGLKTEGGAEENPNASTEKVSHERIITPGETITKQEDEELKEAELSENEQSTRCTSVKEDKHIENHAESLHAAPENIDVSDLSQENSVGPPEEQSRDVTLHGNTIEAEEAAINAVDEHKDIPESLPPIVSSSHKEGSMNAVLEEDTSDHTDGKIVVEVDKHQEALESPSSGEAHCEVTYVSPDVSKGTENTDQTTKDGADTLLLSPKLADQPVESAANEGTSAEEILQHAEESNRADKDEEPEQHSKYSAVLTPEDDHDKDDTREVTQLPNDTSSDHHCTNDSSTENVALTEEKLQEINLPSEQILSNAPCISEGEELNIPEKTADDKSVDEKPTEEDMSCNLTNGVSKEGGSDQNEMTSEQEGLQNDHHADGKTIDEVEKHPEVLETLSSGEAHSEVNNFSPDVSTDTENTDQTVKDCTGTLLLSPKFADQPVEFAADEEPSVEAIQRNAEESGITDEDVVPEQCINDSPVVASVIDDPEMDGAKMVTQLSKDTSSDHHGTNDSSKENVALTEEIIQETNLTNEETESDTAYISEAEELNVQVKTTDNKHADEKPTEEDISSDLTNEVCEKEEVGQNKMTSEQEVLENERSVEDNFNTSADEASHEYSTSGETITTQETSNGDELQSKNGLNSSLSKEEETTVEVGDRSVTKSEDIGVPSGNTLSRGDVECQSKTLEDEEHKIAKVSESEQDPRCTSVKEDVQIENPAESLHVDLGNIEVPNSSQENKTEVLPVEESIDAADKHEEATENLSTTVSTEDAGGSSLSKSDHSENKREDDSVKECEEVPLPLPLSREVDVPTDLHEAQFEDEETEKAEVCDDERSTETTLLKTESITENTEDEHVNFEHTKASDLVEKISEGGTVDATEEKEETLENVPAVVPNDKMEENSYIKVDDQKRENEEQLDKENEHLSSIANNDEGVVKDEEKIEDENPSGVELFESNKNTESDEIEETAIEAANTNEKIQELQNVSNEDRDKDLPIEVDASEMKLEEHERPSLTEPSKDDPNDDKPAILPEPKTGNEKVELLADEKNTGFTAPEKESLENQESSMPEALESKDIDELKYRGEDLIKPDLETGENTETASVKEETEVEKPIASLQVKPEDVKQQDSGPDINRSIEEQISITDPREISIDNTEGESFKTAQTNEGFVEIKDIAKDVPDCDKEDSIQIREVGSPNPLNEASEGNTNDDESTKISEDCLINEGESPESLQLADQDIETPPSSQDRELSSLDEHSPISYPEGITVDNKGEIVDDATGSKDESPKDKDVVISVPSGDSEDNSPTEVDGSQIPSSEKSLAEKIDDDEPTTTHKAKITNEDAVQANLSENEEKIQCAIVEEEVQIDSLQVADGDIKDSFSAQDRKASHFEEQEPITDSHGATGDQKDAETLDLTDPKEETLEDKNHETSPHKETNEDSLQVDGSILEEKEQPKKDGQSTSITDAPEDDITERTLVRELAQVVNPIDSSQVASEDTEEVAPCQDTERSSSVEHILVSEDISSNEVTEKITGATKEEIQEVQDLAKSAPHEDNSPNEQNIEAALTNEDLSTELPQVAVEDTEEQCLSEVRETSSQEEQILSASPGVVIKDNKANETIDPTVIRKEIPEDAVLKEMESVDVQAAKNEEEGYLKGVETTTADTIVASNQETSLSITAEKTPCAEDLNVNKDVTGDILEARNYKQQESSITEVFEEHTVISKERESDSTSTEPGVSEKNNEQIVEEANSCGDNTDSEKIDVLNHGLTAVPASETLVTGPRGCTEKEVKVPYEEKEAEVITQEAENDEKNIKETLPNDASEDVSESKEVNGEDEINSNNYKGLSSSLISVAPEEVSTSNVAVEEDLTSTSSLEPRKETREEADTEEGQNQEPAPQVSELIQDSPVEKIERDTHLSLASADDSVVTEEMQELERVPLPAPEENTIETTDCKESDVVEDATKEEIFDDATGSKDESPKDKDVVISNPSGDSEDNSPTEEDGLQKPSSEKSLAEKIDDDKPTTTHEAKFTNEDAVQANLSNEEKLQSAIVEEEVQIDSLQVADGDIKDSSSAQDREASHFEEQEPTTETLDLTDPKEETLEDKKHETSPNKDTNEDSLQVDGSILEGKKQTEKDSERTLVREVAQVENPIDSSQVAFEDIEVVVPCQDTERSSSVEQILDSEDISSNEVTEKITDATKEEIQEAQDLAKSVPHEDNSPNEQNIEAALTNEYLSMDLPQVAVEDTEEPCLSEVRETSAQEEQILSKSPGVLINDNKENETIDPTVFQKKIPEDEVLKEMESVDVQAETNEEEGYLKGVQTTTADPIVASNQETSLSLTADRNYKQQESSITEVFEEHTVISKEHESDSSTSTEPEVSEKNNDQIVEEANSRGDKTDSEEIEVLNHGLTAVPASETLVADPRGCTETEVKFPYEEKEAEVSNQEAENDEKNIKETLPNDASEDVSESKEVNSEDEINSNNYKGLSSSLISVAPEEVSTSDAALEEDLTSTSSQEPRKETREEADTEEDQNQEPAPQVSELIQDSPVEKIERDTHLSLASADDSVVTEEMQELERVPLPAPEENTIETMDCKESDVVEDATNHLEQDDVTNSFSDDKMPTEKEQETLANDILPASSSETPGVDHFPTERELTNKEEPCTGNTATGDEEEKSDKGNDAEKEACEEKMSGINSAAPDVMGEIDTDVSKLTDNINNMIDSTDSMVINEDTSLEGNLVDKCYATDLETKNDEKAPEIKETAPSSAIGQDAETASVQETSYYAGSLAEVKSDSNEVATTPIENKSGLGLEPIAQDQSCDTNTEEEKLEEDAEIQFDKAVKEDIQEEITHEKEIVKDGILSEKEQSPRVKEEDDDIQEYHQGSCEDEVIIDSHQEEEAYPDQQVNSKETDELTKYGDETEKVAKVSAHADDKAPEDQEDKDVVSEAVERILHQEDQVTSIDEPTADVDDEKANELDIACVKTDTQDKEEEGVQTAVILGRESEEQNKKDEICNTDEVQAKDEEELILSEEKSEEESKETYKEANLGAEKLDFASQTKEISECAISHGSQDTPEDNENSTTNKLSEEDYPNKSREHEVPSAGEGLAVTEQSTVETVITAEVQEAKSGIDPENAVPEAAGLESQEVEEFNDKCAEIADTSAPVENPVVSLSKIIPELTEGTPLEADYNETKLHGLPEELNMKDSEVKTAERDDAVNLQSVRDISEECKESFEVSNNENPMEGDQEEKIDTSEVQETEATQNSPVSETLKQEIEEQQLVRGTEDVHEEEKNEYNIIPKQLESSYGAETEKVPEPSIHHSSTEDTAQHENKEENQQNVHCSDIKTSEKDLPVNVGGVSNVDASEQKDKHIVLEADDSKNSNPENLNGDSSKISSEISVGEHETVKPQKLEKEEKACKNEEGTNQEMKAKPESGETSPMADHSPAGKEPASHTEDLQAEKTDEAEHETSKTDEEESSREQEKSDLSSEAPVMVDMGDADDVKVTPKKSHNILSGVGSKVKHSIAKVKKAITGKSSHPKTPSPSKVVN